MIERKIGETFKFKKITLICERAGVIPCFKCYFMDKACNQHYNEIGYCIDVVRRDKKSVVFRKV
jgi:hypothetical protein